MTLNSTFRNLVTKLNKEDHIKYPTKGSVALTDMWFPCGRPSD